MLQIGIKTLNERTHAASQKVAFIERARLGMRYCSAFSALNQTVPTEPLHPSGAGSRTAPPYRLRPTVAQSRARARLIQAFLTSQELASQGSPVELRVEDDRRRWRLREVKRQDDA